MLLLGAPVGSAADAGLAHQLVARIAYKQGAGTRPKRRGSIVRVAGKLAGSTLLPLSKHARCCSSCQLLRQFGTSMASEARELLTAHPFFNVVCCC